MSLAAFPKQFGQLGDVAGNPPRLIFAEQLGCGKALVGAFLIVDRCLGSGF
jgi:hypothetical protein